MTSIEVLGIIAGTFGVAMGASPLLQAMRAHKRRSARDVSLSFIAVLVAGGATWLSYGVVLSNIALIVGNAVGVVSATTAFAVSVYWRRSEARDVADSALNDQPPVRT